MVEADDAGASQQNALDVARDEQTNKLFKIVPETPWATAVASVSAVYLITAIAALLWLLFDTWSGRNLLLISFGYDKAALARDSFRLMAYVAIGGALGATVDGMRSIISWHAERKAYGPRFIWKDLSLPFIGAAVGIMVYVTVRGGVGVFNGDFSLDQAGGTAKLAAFAVSSLAGFSSWQVFRWIDSKANHVFSVVEEPSADAAGSTATTRASTDPLMGRLLSELQLRHVSLNEEAQEAIKKEFSARLARSPNPEALKAGWARNLAQYVDLVDGVAKQQRKKNALDDATPVILNGDQVRPTFVTCTRLCPDPA